MSIGGRTRSGDLTGPRRLVFAPGDFFQDGLPEAELYILSRILHDCSDDGASELLKRVAGSCKPGETVPHPGPPCTPKHRFHVETNKDSYREPRCPSRPPGAVYRVRLMMCLIRKGVVGA